DVAVTTQFNTEVPITLLSTNPGSVAATYQIVDSPAHGTVRTSGTPSIVYYTPAAGFSGNDTFTFRLVFTGTQQSNVATVRIFVFPKLNHIPTVMNRRAAVFKDSPGRPITLTGHDDDNDPLTFSIMTPPSIGTLSGPAPGTGDVVYTPPPGFV